MKGLGVAAFALGTLAACQTTSETATIQNLNVNICDPGSPVIKPWNGKIPALTTDSMQVIVPVGGSKAPQAVSSGYLAVVSETNTGKLSWGATLTESQLATYAAGAIRAGGIIGPGGGGGWPPCQDGPNNPDCLVAVNAIGVYAKLSLQGAQAAAEACN